MDTIIEAYLFPQYRKYGNGSSYFKIFSLEYMEERKALGTSFLFFEIEAKSYYEKYQIKDLLECSFEQIIIIDAEEYNAIVSKI
jgi:hypothetical protein